ncbi:DUF475 domain-containing protein [Candidatus Micrarchaeota archaeon]|nr:DUF475 domain-containing protein [Candidatus Micrarchaeota archaeon]
MDLLAILVIILGLGLFETISSFDNAVINAEILRKMSPWARRWFLIWGILFAVFLVRGVLPLLIVWSANPTLSVMEVLTAAFSSDPRIVEAVESSAPLLLTGGGVFLIFLFFHWLFMEPKHYGLLGEKFFHGQGVWFYAVISILLSMITWFALKVNPMMAFSAVVGSTAFFIVHGFKQHAELKEKEMLAGKGLGDISMLLYLEVIDATFSVDGVVGAFAFTISVPLVIIGNGLGAFVVREFTVRNIEAVKKYKYLKNGAMYSILFLGAVMLADSFGNHVPFWISPTVTIATVGYFFWKSMRELKRESKMKGSE